MEDINNCFEFASGRRSGSRSLRNFKSSMVRSNMEAVEGAYRKLVSKYKYPLWLNVRGAALADRSTAARLSFVYYIYVKEGNKAVDFLGVCFLAPSKDLIFSVRLRKVVKWLPYISSSLAALDKA